VGFSSWDNCQYIASKLSVGTLPEKKRNIDDKLPSITDWVDSTQGDVEVVQVITGVFATRVWYVRRSAGMGFKIHCVGTPPSSTRINKRSG
jgi:hypothetical protein